MQTTSGLVVSRNATDGAEVTHFKIISIAGGLLFQSNGTTAISSGAFITFAQANAGLKFTPALNSTATGHCTVQASTNNNDAGLGGNAITADISVTLPAPTITGPTPVTTAQRPTITWTSMTGAATYELRVNRIDVATKKIVYRTGLTATSFTPLTALPIGTYRIWVRAVSTSSQVSRWSLPLVFSIIAVTDEPVSAPGDLLLTHLTLLDDAALQISEQPTSATDDAVIPAETNGDHVSAVDSKFNLEVTEQLPHRADVAAYGSRETSGSDKLPPLIDIDETAVDQLMAALTTMKLFLQI